MFASICLITILFVGCGLAWKDLVHQWLNRQPLLDRNSEPRARYRSAPELTGIYIALLWLVFHLFPYFLPSDPSPKKPISVDAVANGAAINFALCLILPIILTSGNRTMAGIGMSLSNLGDQFRVGVRFFFAAVLPMTVSMIATLPIRSLDRQHSLLKLLADSPTVTTIVVIAITAVLSAPLLEELLFRVILQGWLTTMVPSSVAISVVAVLFSLVHGWRDGLALLPLAFILGYVFDRRHSYWSVVMIHALFNATMLILQLLIPKMP